MVYGLLFIYLLFIIYYLLFIIYYLLFIIYYLLFIICKLPGVGPWCSQFTNCTQCNAYSNCSWCGTSVFVSRTFYFIFNYISFKTCFCFFSFLIRSEEHT